MEQKPTSYKFFDRDLSWLSFNDRVLDEAAKADVPLLERIKFLAIYSSNLDEFYRVRVPVIKALKVLSDKNKIKPQIENELSGELETVQKTVIGQQQKFGRILVNELLPLLLKQSVNLVYNTTLPVEIEAVLTDYFYSNVLGYLHPLHVRDIESGFFVDNNKLYFLVVIHNDNHEEQTVILNIPSDHLPRFFTTNVDGTQFVVFLDDIIRWNLNKLFPGYRVTGVFSFKVTRDAALDLDNDFDKDMVALIEKQLAKRDHGLATRFLHEPGIPAEYIKLAIEKLNLNPEAVVEGGRYHNLRDLFAFPVKIKQLEYDKWPPVQHKSMVYNEPIFEIISRKDLLVHPPYHSYNPILRFFNEAATNSEVTEIYTSIYRVASDSRIAGALVTAALNGKKVQVLIELKARFDEANNIKWGKQMKEAGVKIIYTSKKIKVHAKVALVKKSNGQEINYYGLLATGNFNEGTAALYTDFILMTASKPILLEVEKLFSLMTDKDGGGEIKNPFKELLVARYNLKNRFMTLIDREITHAKAGLSAEITIKLNNLEERDLISKLYDASCAGVKISLIVRSICCLIPGIAGMSENIKVTRIVDRFLEHSRVFIFCNNNEPEVFLGSADWMNRNIYHRIEVVFPVHDNDIRKLVINITGIQLADNVHAVFINENLGNIAKEHGRTAVQSQREIYQLICSSNK